MRHFKIAIAQMHIALGDKKANLEKISVFSSKAAEQDASFICFPEYFSTGSIPEKFKELAETIPGDTTNKLSEIAEKNKINIIGSLAEKTDKNLYNTAVMIDSKGEIKAKHRKIHLFLDEANFLAHGNKCSVVETEYGKIGLIVCYDAVFPEVSRKLAINGAKIIFIPANWPDPFMPQWMLASSARALDNQLWVVAVNRCGKDKRFSYFGKSRIVNPYGDILCECNGKEEIIISEIDMNKSDEFKSVVNFLNDRQQIK
jgi:omega-amidase